MRSPDTLRDITGFVEHHGPKVARRSPFESPGYDRRFEANVEVESTEDGIVLECHLPDVQREAVKIDIEDGVLTVSGRPEPESSDPGDTRAQDTFARSFRLPEGLDEARTEAELHDGRLRIHIPWRPPHTGDHKILR